MLRVGSGWDIHRLTENRPLILGGVEIPYSKGCLGHSDGDALLHAITDALLGAAGFEDIGALFPDTDPKYKDADSSVLLKEVYRKLQDAGFEIINIDCTVIIESPKLGSYKDLIKEKIAGTLGIKKETIAVKAKTAEKMLGELGTNDAVIAQSTVLIQQSTLS